MLRNYIILDRDGVINKEIGARIRHVDELLIIPHVAAAIAGFWQLGYTVTVATNQSGVGRGELSRLELWEIHKTMRRSLLLLNQGAHIEEVNHCPHLPEVNCGCRKPGIQMLPVVMRRTINPATSWMVGDSITDYEFGKNLCTRTCLVTSPLWSSSQVQPDYEAKDLFDFYTWLRDQPDEQAKIQRFAVRDETNR